MVRRNRFATLAALALGLSSSVAAYAQTGTAVSGSMGINFVTRTPEGQDGSGAPIKGAQDQYNLDLLVNGNNEFRGYILRQPRIKQFKIRTIQEPRYDYKIDLFVTLKSGQKPNVGSWVGAMGVDEKSGAFFLDTGDPSRSLRMNITAGTGFTDAFGGRFYGLAQDKTTLSWETLKRTINGHVVEKKFQADPIKFDHLILAKGPNPKQYSAVEVNGSLDYDRETSNYYAKGLTFSYVTPDGKQVQDVVSGTIKWVEAPDRKTTGVGHYEFNLRFNEDKAKPAQSDDQAFGGKSDDDLFFAVDANVPALTGTIDYVDTFGSGGADAPPVSSKVTYNLTENKLNPQQVMNFAKMWLIVCGPANDE